MTENINKPLVANLYTVSHYSLLDSILSIDDIISLAINNGQEYVCLADKNLYGAIDFYKKAIKNKLKPVIGLNFLYGDNQEEIVVYAKNYNGYKNLIKISSFIEKKINFEIDDYLNDTFIVCLTNNTFIKNNSHVYFLDQKHKNRIAINKIKCLDKNDAYICKILNCISNGQTIDDIDVLKNSKYDYFAKNLDDIVNDFDIVAINNLNNEILSVNLEIEFNKNFLPIFPISDKKYNSKTYLKKMCEDNLNQKILLKKIDPNLRSVYESRYEYELDVINKMNFNDYFLIVQDFIQYANNNDILVGPGRGSVAGSLVAYLLGITQVDSIKYDLVFERFLNPSRITMPDIDIDIMDSKREKVISYLFEKYGYDKTAHIITFQKIKAKMAIRDVGRVLNIDLKIINKIAKLIKPDHEEDLNLLIDDSKEAKIFAEQFPDLFFISNKIIGCPRQTGLHAAGIVLSSVELNNIVPTQYGSNEEISTQFSMEFLEELGLIKMDLLGLINLTILNNLKKLIKHLHKIDIDFNEIDLNDQKVFKLLSLGHTIGIFQLESPGMTKLVKRMQIKSIEDISLCSSLFRPGPQKNIDPFIKRRNGIEPIEYPHKSLEQHLKNTYGIIVYQEQVINIVKFVGGFSASEADNFRRIIAKKYSHELDNFKIDFQKRALANNYTQKEFEEIYEYIYRFADYGFNHSHSISYSIISFWLAYFKCYFPVEFMITLMKSFEASVTKINDFIVECKRLKITVLPPCINDSSKSFSLKGRKILMGFSSVKGIGEETARKIINIRDSQKNKIFDDYVNAVKLLTANGVGKSTIETLIYSGMFDVFELTRIYMLKNLDEVISVSKQIKKDGNFLFEPKLVDYNETDEIKNELNFKMFELLGYDFNQSSSINVEFSNEQKAVISQYNVQNLNDVSNGKFFALVKIKASEKKLTKTGKDMMSFYVVDRTGEEMKLTCFSKEVINSSYDDLNKWYIVQLKFDEKWKQLLYVKEVL